MSSQSQNLAASVRDRLLNIARSKQEDFQSILTRYTLERLLYHPIKATFERRKTALPVATPLALSSEFFEDESKQKQWNAFLKKGKLKSEDKELQAVILTLQSFLLPPTQAVVKAQAFNQIWLLPGLWQQ